MSALITLSDIAFSANGRDILHDINFSISRDQILTIVGPNGAGKSTLLSLILGHNRPSRGTISRIKGLKISFVPQKFHPPADLPITARRFLRDIPQAAARAGHQDRAAGQRRSGQRQLGAGAGLGETVGQTELLGAGGDGHGDVSRSGLDGPHVVQAASGGAHLGEGIIKGRVCAHGRFPRILGF